MIYTLTLSPAVDLHINTITKTSYCLAGGKGINVSKVLKNLGIDSTCLGFIGGLTGKFILNDLNKNKIKSSFVVCKNPTRVNMKIACGKEVEINSKSLPISKQEYKQLVNKLLKLKCNDILIVSGSLPQDLDLKQIKRLLDVLYKNKIKFIFDISSKLLLKACKYKPILIKPNIDELSNLFNKKIKKNKDINIYINKLISLGAQNVIVSLGKNGAILANKNKVVSLKAPKGKLVSSVGAGDSMVAGFVSKYKNLDDKQLLAFALACGSATAFSKGLATKKKIMEIYKLWK